MALLREFTQGERPVRIELLSDPDEGKVGDWECARSCCASTPPPDQSAEAVPLSPPLSFPTVNYEDYNINVSLPIFSIHGNHDDPTGTYEVRTPPCAPASRQPASELTSAALASVRRAELARPPVDGRPRQLLWQD
jgi:hypothetical protein